MTPVRLPALLVAVLLLVASSLLAQTPPPPPPPQVPQFRAQTDLIEVDVSVLDGQRKPVAGLKTEDFTVIEDKVPQTISAFAEVQLSNPDPGEAEWLRNVPHDVENNRLGDRRLIVLLLDDTKDMDPLTLQTAKKMCHAVVDHLGADDMAAVVYTGNQRAAQDFTSDRARLREAINRFTFNYGYRALYTLNLLLDSLATVTNRRKTIFYVSLGEPFNRNALGPMRDIYGDPQGPQRQLLHEMQEVFRKSRLGNVNVYTIDPSGLKAPMNALGPMPGEMQREFMQIIAGETGGRALVNTNAPDRDVPGIFRENSSYYLLGYRSTNQATDGKFRRIQVRMNKRGLNARARSGYYAPTPESATTSRGPVVPSNRVGQVLAGLVPSPGLPMTIAAAPFARPDGSGGSIALVVGIEPTSAAAEANQQLTVLMSVFSPEGAPRGQQPMSLPLVPEPGSGERIRVQAYGRFDLPPGSYRVRAAAYTPDRNQSGSVFTDVTIPNFAMEPVSLTGLAFETQPAVRSVPATIFTPFMPIKPTTERSFGQLAQVTGFVRVHQGGTAPMRPVRLLFQVYNAKNGIGFEKAEQLDPSRFSPVRGLDVQFDLPVKELLAGPYLLRVTATAGNAGASRDMRFTVR